MLCFVALSNGINNIYRDMKYRLINLFINKQVIIGMEKVNALVLDTETLTPRLHNASASEIVSFLYVLTLYDEASDDIRPRDGSLVRSIFIIELDHELRRLNLSVF